MAAVSGCRERMSHKLSFYNNLFLQYDTVMKNWSLVMPCTVSRSAVAITISALAIAAISPGAAAPSTSQGQISVLQVEEMFEKASTDRTAQQVLTAYLGGVGEAAGAVTTIGGASCKTPLSLSSTNAQQALRAAAAGQNIAEVAATPLIVRDMLERAQCNRR